MTIIPDNAPAAEAIRDLAASRAVTRARAADAEVRASREVLLALPTDSTPQPECDVAMKRISHAEV